MKHRRLAFTGPTGTASSFTDTDRPVCALPVLAGPRRVLSLVGNFGSSFPSWRSIGTSLCPVQCNDRNFANFMKKQKSEPDMGLELVGGVGEVYIKQNNRS